jgi:hypothetical protein
MASAIRAILTSRAALALCFALRASGCLGRGTRAWFDDEDSCLDVYARERGLRSRSAAMREAVRMLRVSELVPAYEAASAEWHASGEAAAWESVASDGLRD